MSLGTIHDVCTHLYTFLIFQGDIIPIKRSESLDVIVLFVLQVETPEVLSGVQRESGSLSSIQMQPSANIWKRHENLNYFTFLKDYAMEKSIHQ